jgi:nitrate/nitrite transport system ATP-binding protein
VAFFEASALSKSFGSPAGVREVLHDASLSVSRGEFVAIVGATGCGKSTLLHLLSGLTRPDSGSMTLDGISVTGVHRDVALVFQNYSLLPWFSALENVRLAVDAAFPDWTAQRQREQAQRYLQHVGLGNALGRRPSQLSGGMRQRVAIARAFAIEPTILFLDEPFGALDALTRGSLQQELSRLCASPDRPVTVVMITNSVNEAILLADRILPMMRGPRATLGASIPVGLQRPRASDSLLHDAEAIRVRARVVDALTGNLSAMPGSPTARDNVTLALGRDAGISHRRRTELADNYLQLVGVSDAADERPAGLSLGTEQRVALARALASEPRFLLLDEPFSQLDSLTRFELQDTLLRVWEETRQIVVMVTHDVDEALYLADRLILMTDGPEATIGAVLRVDLPRPRTRCEVLAHPTYYDLRKQVIDFLEGHAHQSRPSALGQVLERYGSGF